MRRLGLWALRAPEIRASRSIVAGTVATAVACVLVGSATARPSGDVAVTLGFGSLGSLNTGVTTTASKSFRISIIAESSASASEQLVLNIRLGDGLAWGPDAPDAGDGCKGTAPAICTGTTEFGQSGNFKFWTWEVVAASTGAFEITASVSTNLVDPDLSNNSTTFRFEVTSPTVGGGGSAAISASAVKLSPSKPIAGSSVVAVVRVTKGGAPMRPSGVVCTASIGSVSLKGTGKAALGIASCLFKPPKRTIGKTLRGSVAFSAGGTSVTKRFAAKLR